jgi:SAM-dependent methyltransferase
VGGSGANAFWFVRSGRQDFEVFRQAIEEHAGRPLRELCVLDFGAGIGRLLSYFVAACREVHATDVNGAGIAYLQRAFPTITCKTNAFLPPLDYPSERFDVVCSFSVWTHLADREQQLWLGELRRVLRPGGLALVSVHGPIDLRRKHQDPAWRSVTEEELRAKGLIHVSYSRHGLQRAPASSLKSMPSGYGYTLQTHEQIRATWSQYFDIVAMEEAAFRQHQDLVVLRKPREPSSPEPRALLQL